MLTVTMLLAVLALILTIVSGAGWCPLWVPVLLLAILQLLEHIPK